MVVEKMAYDELNNDLFARLQVDGNDVTITACYFSEEQEAAAIALANKTLQWLVTGLEKAKQFAATELVPVKNLSWLDENEPEITESQFISRIKLTGIYVYGDENFELFFDDNGMFAAHIIIVTFDENFQFGEASLAG